MLEWLATIGAAELGKVVFEQVLKLGQASAEDYVKDFFKGCLKGGLLAAKPEVAKKATAAAVQAFLLLLVDELEDQDVSQAEIRDRYDQPLVQFVKDEAVKPLLGNAFEKDCRAIDVATLATLWQRSTFKGQPFPVLPEGFDWQHVGNEYLRKVRRLVRETPELKALLETELLEDIARNTAQISPGFDVASYRHSLQTSYGYLKLYTLDSTDRVDAIKLWQMFIEQTVREALPPMRYELPLDLKRQLQEQGQLEADLSSEALEHYRREYFQQPSRKAFEAISASPRAVILGDPGAGKSSLLQYLAMEWVEGKTETLPLLIELREYALAQANSFLEFLHRGRGADWQFDQQLLHQYLLEHPTLVMFDGLDEVFDRATQSAVIDDIIRFAQQYPQAKVLVTSRIMGYNPERLQHAEFQHFTIQPLDTDEVHEFIDRWYTLALLNDPDKPRLVQRLKDAIANSKAIQNLADNPLLLTMMAILNRRQELPRDRADLYDQASRVLLYHWDVDHKRLQLPMDAIGRREKQEMLRAIAYEMQAGEEGLKGNLISAERLTRILTDYLRDQGFSEPREKANRLIQQLRERNFILCYRGADTYGFVHRTFLEYFCAMEIVERFSKRGVEGGITFEQLQDEVFGQHWQDETWHEVLQLICGMIDTKFSGQLIETLLAQRIDQIDSDKNQASKWRKGNLALEQLSNLLLAVDCLLEISNTQAISEVYNVALQKLKETVEQPKDGLNRQLAKAVLNRIARNFSEDLYWLKNLVQSSQNDIVQREAIEAIAKNYRDCPSVLPWLYKCIQDKRRTVQWHALEVIVECYRDHSDTWLWLHSQFQQADNWQLRLKIVEVIAEHYQDNSDTLLWLFTCVQEDRDLKMRWETVQVIIKHYRSHPNTLTWLQSCVQNDEKRDVRLATLWTLLTHYSTHPKTLEFLYDRATNDPDEQLREWAQQQLEQREKQKQAVDPFG